MSPVATQIQAPPGAFVDADWLEAHLDHPGLRVVDVRGRHFSSPKPHVKRAEYEAAHIPGAVLADWEHDLVDPDDPVPYQVAAPHDVALHAERLGVGDGDLVVTYDDYYGIFAARLAWAFRLHGCEARVLDGGWPTWSEEGRTVTSATPERPPARFTPRAPARPSPVAERVRGVARARGDRPRRATATPLPGRAGSARHRAHPRRALRALPGAG